MLLDELPDLANGAIEIVVHDVHSIQTDREGRFLLGDCYAAGHGVLGIAPAPQPASRPGAASPPEPTPRPPPRGQPGPVKP